MERPKRDGGSFLPYYFDESELEVVDILADLPRLILKFDSGCHCQEEPNLSWGTRRRRSVSSNSASPPTPPASSSSPAPPPAVPPIIEKERRQREPQSKIEATSPTTPLCFLPSECDEKPTHYFNSKRNKKRTFKELLADYEELNSRKDKLTEEVEKARRLYNQLSDENLMWKGICQQVISGLGNEKAQSEKTTKSLNLELKLEQNRRNPMAICAHQSQPYHHGQLPQFLRSVNDGGPIPDLNEPADEVEEGVSIKMGALPRLESPVTTVSVSRIRAAEARRRRRMVILGKKYLHSLGFSTKQQQRRRRQ